MDQEIFNKIWKMMGLRYTSHPWHGISIGAAVPDTVTAFIEVIPSDTVKYEVDKPKTKNAKSTLRIFPKRIAKKMSANFAWNKPGEPASWATTIRSISVC